MRFFVFSFSLFLGFMAKAQTSPCFREHLLRALALNEQRLSKYSLLSQGRSVVVSKSLIRMEKTMLTVSEAVMPFDLWNQPYQRAHFNLICESYVSMDLVPAFGTLQQKSNGQVIRWGSFGLKLAFTKGDFADIKAKSLVGIRALSVDPASHCLTRHFLESIARIASLAATADQKALAQGLPPPRNIFRSLIFGHLAMLNWAASIDRSALPLQKEGLPILCQDIPPIAIPESGPTGTQRYMSSGLGD